MALNFQRCRQYLQRFEFQPLFVEELGWDQPGASLSVQISSDTFVLTAVAQKRGLAAFVCGAPANGRIPDYPTRRKIERQVAKSAFEHLIVFVDKGQQNQVWQWVKRETGKPVACREHAFNRAQPGDSLIGKLERLAFTLAEEEEISIVVVAGRTKAAFDVERVTKKFYECFKTEHKAFLGFIEGIEAQADREWYASLMLNRLMFVYFIQKKGFLDGDVNYLRDRLQVMKEQHGGGTFLTFYRHFLLRLFQEGLGQELQARASDLDQLIGKVPYLDGGLFDVHELERNYPSIEISDDAFERIFDFFDFYQWHLDERPLRDDDEINPDVLGYIFEKYINQKQMGAYYTKEDITGYISKNTIIPLLLERTRDNCLIAFDAAPSVWDLLRSDPDRYVYPAVRKGVDISLPPGIEAGISDVAGRTEWNKPARENYALPTETWREVAARRDHYDQLRRDLLAGKVRSADELVTRNLDLHQFALDLVESSEGPDLLRSAWQAITEITVLDPTCGSGAFLFAVLNVLDPLYEACLERMAAFVADADRSATKGQPKRFSDFRTILENVEAHPNRRYFILKSIIVNNLYGVDIMEEAAEIAKLRLFLKLVAQVERAEKIEPLPDIDFNIRAGNTLVGFVGKDDVIRALTTAPNGNVRLPFPEDLAKAEKVEQAAKDAERSFQIFRDLQTRLRLEEGDRAAVKEQLKAALRQLAQELDHYLANQYGVDSVDTLTLSQWRLGHQPFHWYAEFYGIMANGGFDVVIGNPPYVVYSRQAVGYGVEPLNYITLQAKNLFPLVFERSLALAKASAPVSLIVQLTALTGERMTSLQDLLIKRGTMCAVSFPRRPQSIFDGVEMPVTILTSLPRGPGVFVTSSVRRFYTEERPYAIDVTSLAAHFVQYGNCRIAKFGSQVEVALYNRLARRSQPLELLTRKGTRWLVYYQEACRYWVKALKGLPYFRRNGEDIAPPHGRTLTFYDESAACFAVCLLNSSLFYWWYSVFSDCEHINDSLIRTFPIPISWSTTNWKSSSNELMESLGKQATRKVISTKQGHTIEYDEIKVLHVKPLIDRIDRLLASHYNLAPSELDFVINYDIKYRMRQGDVSEDEE